MLSTCGLDIVSYRQLLGVQKRRKKRSLLPSEWPDKKIVIFRSGRKRLIVKRRKKRDIDIGININRGWCGFSFEVISCTGPFIRLIPGKSGPKKEGKSEEKKEGKDAKSKEDDKSKEKGKSKEEKGKSKEEKEKSKEKKSGEKKSGEDKKSGEKKKTKDSSGSGSAEDSKGSGGGGSGKKRSQKSTN